MKHNLFKTGVVICLLILLSGSILQTLGGTSDMSSSSQHAWGNDDAFISYCYARNLAEGKGLVFNPGERVEAYSNFLYVLLMAPAFWVTNNDGAYFFSISLNLMFACAAFLLFVADLRKRLGESSALAGALLFALCLLLWVAVASGLETPLVLAIAIAIWVMTEQVASEPTPRAVYLLCLAMVASLLARADGFIIVGVALFYLLLKRQFRALAVCASVVVAAMGIYELWRVIYYGYPLPNSYYVKVAGPMGLRVSNAYEQLSTIAAIEGLMPFLLVIPFVLVEKIRKAPERSGRIAEEISFDLVFPVVWLAYWFYIGGDIFWDRFLIVLYPLGIFALLRFFAGNASAKVLTFVVVTLAVMEVAPPLKVDPRFHYRFNEYDCLITAGKFLRQNYPGKTVATGAIGKLPFFSGLYTQDMLGLADPVLAHRSVADHPFELGHMKYDSDYSLSRKPDLIADWIQESLDMSYDLTRAKYEKAGYRVEYLIDTRGTASGQSIINVEGADDTTLRQWVAQGYTLAILVRQ